MKGLLIVLTIMSILGAANIFAASTSQKDALKNVLKAGWDEETYYDGGLHSYTILRKRGLKMDYRSDDVYLIQVDRDESGTWKFQCKKTEYGPTENYKY